jgi:aarF domain-containing kinase
LLVPKRQLDEVDKGQELKKTRERLMYEASMKEEQEMRDTIGGRVHPIVAFVRDWIWEPVTTALRFVHLTIIFLPVLVTMPLVLIGPVKMHKANERWGALVWYKYLTWTMEAAGPSFIKVIDEHEFSVDCALEFVMYLLVASMYTW